MTPPITSQGKLSSHIPTRSIAVSVVVGFIAKQLEDFPAFRGMKPDQNENFYNQRLALFLGVRARKHCDAIQFSREIIHETPGSHDVGVFPADEEGLFVRGRVVGADEPIYTVECKRLPAPESAREREYVTSERNEKKRGAIQRYKHCIHGAGLNEAGIVGYIQEKEPELWRTTINEWVEQLKANPVDEAAWSESDRLKSHKKFKRKKNVLVSVSESARIRSKNIKLTHFFVDIRASRQTEWNFD